MRSLRAALFCTACVIAAPAFAGEEVLYAPAPQWVEPADLQAAMERNTPIVLVDRQRRVEDGTEKTFNEVAFRLTSPESITQLGTLSVNWLPDKGDLTVHRLEIHREEEVVDLLEGGARFDVLRRERRLEQRTLDGQLSATLSVPGLRVGDVLRFSSTRTNRDQAMDGDVQLLEGLMTEGGQEVGFARLLISWPEDEDISWQPGPRTDLAPPVTQDGYKVLEIEMPVAEPEEVPQDAPGRFKIGPMVQVGSFSSWEEVSALFAPYYQTDGTIAQGSPIGREIARIEAATSDDAERAAMVLRFVQDEIAYLANGMEGGNYIPQSPVETWESRLGDCKAKTLLLLAMLHEMDIEAEAAVVHASNGDAIPALLPMPAAFNHVVVRAEIDGTEYWLDGTSAGTRLSTMAEVPNFENALPLRAEGAPLMAVEQRWQPRPDRVIRATFDHSAGIDMPVVFDAEIELAGLMAAQWRQQASITDEDEIWSAVTNYVSDLFPESIVTRSAISYDDDSAIATIDLTGVGFSMWSLDGAEASHEPWLETTGMQFQPNRAREAWREIPVQNGGPLRLRDEVTIILPDGGEGYTLDGILEFDGEIGGVRIFREIERDGDRIEIVDDFAEIPTEIPASEIAEVRAETARYAAGDPEIEAPRDALRGWHFEPEEAAERYARLDRELTRLVEADPEQAFRLTLRGGLRATGYDREGAIEDFTQALSMSPSSEIYSTRAETFRNMGKMDRAVEDAREAFALQPDVAHGSYLALLLAETGAAEEAYKMLDDLDASGDERFELVQVQADVAGQVGQLDEGWQMLADALLERPGSADLLNAQCWYAGTWQHHLEEAVDVCTRAVETSQWSANVLDSRALAYYRLGRYDEALADLEAALRNMPALGPSRYLRGIIRAETGMEESGRRDIAQALRVSPSVRANYARYGIVPPS